MDVGCGGDRVGVGVEGKTFYFSYEKHKKNWEGCGGVGWGRIIFFKKKT